MSPSDLSLVLDHARARTDALLAPLSDEELTRQVSPLQSPLVWDLAHIANFEEVWLLRRAGGREALLPEPDDLYDSFAHARADRAELPILSPSDARAYAREVRASVLEVLPRLAFDNGDPLLAQGFVVGMVAQHELQHAETMAQTLALDGVSAGGPLEVHACGEVTIPGGPFTLGSDDAWAYDNERPAHEVGLPSYRIDRALVTNDDFAAFVDAGGYRDRELWSRGGWAWLESEQVEPPAAESRRAPVQHVSFHEAEAYARWVGKRLPTEPEWEKAAKTAPGELEHLQGAVWQWTSSVFDGYPGFHAFPYREYSEPFFGGGYRVLRGGSWVTDPLVARPTFRNWDFPQRRQIFSGLRCASDG